LWWKSVTHPDQLAAELVELEAECQPAGRSQTAACPKAGQSCPIMRQFKPVCIPISACAIVMPSDTLGEILPPALMQKDEATAG